MPRTLALLLAALMLSVQPGLALAADPTTAPATASAPLQSWESKENGVALQYPATWKVITTEPRGVQPNEILSAKVTNGPITAFQVAIYKLAAPLNTDDEAATEAFYNQLDTRVTALVAALPAGAMLDVSDITVDDVDGREYSYDHQINGQLVHVDMILLPNGDKLYEVTQWALDAEYDDQVDNFDAIFDSLRLPWSPPAVGAG